MLSMRNISAVVLLWGMSQQETDAKQDRDRPGTQRGEVRGASHQEHEFPSSLRTKCPVWAVWRHGGWGAAGGRLGDGLSFWELKYSTVDYTTLNILKSIDLYTLSR